MLRISSILQSIALSALLVGGAHAASKPADKASVVAAAGHHASPARHASHGVAHAAKKTPQKVNINSADAKTLHASLLNIGQSKAEAIVAWRKQHGAFRSADELAQVKGIGLKTIEKNRSYIVLGAVASAGKH
ncbi:MAG: ComEA family DNA-binding protein [Proteobacteria bacterium]|nr:ComEA family DNA-binding protein [Pseudomonadota bacterium]MBS0464844.1 ComEA family DNA-binding protein [Pseudomonadota bacterium]